MSTPVRIAIVGAGGVSELHHVPGIRLDHRCELVAICDADESRLQRARDAWGVADTCTDYQAVVARPDIDAVVIATPNVSHAPIAMAAIAAGKHVLCEKPLALSAADGHTLYQAAERAGVVHMTAFTYRFAPAMRFLAQLLKAGQLGEPRHFRSQRFLDWPETSWGWRQYRALAGAGDLYDMTTHRLDFAMDLLGPIEEICGAVARFAPRTSTVSGQACAPSDVDDWSALIGRFRCGAFGVWEGTTLAKGHHHNGFGHEWAEINGSEASAVYRLHRPNTILLGRHAGDLEEVEVPDALLKPAESPRSTVEPHAAIAFRYDVVWEFTSAICERRAARPSFYDGWRAQVVADAVLASQEQRAWIRIPEAPLRSDFVAIDGRDDV
jgi:predicted dehydrogenase